MLRGLVVLVSWGGVLASSVDMSLMRPVTTIHHNCQCQFPFEFNGVEWLAVEQKWQAYYFQGNKKVGTVIFLTEC